MDTLKDSFLDTFNQKLAEKVSPTGVTCTEKIQTLIILALGQGISPGTFFPHFILTFFPH